MAKHTFAFRVKAVPRIKWVAPEFLLSNLYISRRVYRVYQN